MRISDWSSDVCSSDLMLRQVARRLQQFADEAVQPLDLAIVRIEPRLDQPPGRYVIAPASPACVGEPRGHILAEPQRLADLADRAARAIMDDGRGDSRAPTAVSVIDMLDHLLAPLMFEIDVDVGRLVALGRNEAREKKRVFHRIDRGAAEQEADARIDRSTEERAVGKECDSKRKS